MKNDNVLEVKFNRITFNGIFWCALSLLVNLKDAINCIFIIFIIFLYFLDCWLYIKNSKCLLNKDVFQYEAKSFFGLISQKTMEFGLTLNPLQLYIEQEFYYHMR